MKLYIRATGNISPQHSFGHPPLLQTLADYQGNRLACIEPDYKSFIDAKLIRRMSRIIKMGVAAAMECLQEANISVPDAIVTGTAYGCLEDTGNFLSKMVEQEESLLTPTAFIQSTHNTVGAQIALLLHCNGYNNVFVHRGFSFESALLDGMLLLKEGAARHVLVGGLDEITEHSHAIHSRFGMYKQRSDSSLNLTKTTGKGTIAGEGAAFFLLSSEATDNDYAQLEGLAIFYQPGSFSEIKQRIRDFLLREGVDPGQIDLVITGKNGDASGDAVYEAVLPELFPGRATIPFKNLCGEYPTAIAFALWLAAGILKEGGVLPAGLRAKGEGDKPIRRILIYNHSLLTHHSLLLVSAC